MERGTSCRNNFHLAGEIVKAVVVPMKGKSQLLIR